MAEEFDQNWKFLPRAWLSSALCGRSLLGNSVTLSLLAALDGSVTPPGAEEYRGQKGFSSEHNRAQRQTQSLPRVLPLGPNIL